MQQHSRNILPSDSKAPSDPVIRGKKVRKVAKIRNQYNQVPHQTQNTTWESYKNTVKHQ